MKKVAGKLRLAGMALVVLASLAACTSSTPAARPPVHHRYVIVFSTSAPDGGPLTIRESAYYILTRLASGPLCDTMSVGEAADVLYRNTLVGAYRTDPVGSGVICEWKAVGDPAEELYLRLSPDSTWLSAQTGAGLRHETPMTVDGYNALGVGPRDGVPFAIVEVGLGHQQDPDVEFRAPTLGDAEEMTTLVVPRLIALAQRSPS